jgi:hypothetical protein
MEVYLSVVVNHRAGSTCKSPQQKRSGSSDDKRSQVHLLAKIPSHAINFVA